MLHGVYAPRCSSRCCRAQGCEALVLHAQMVSKDPGPHIRRSKTFGNLMSFREVKGAGLNNSPPVSMSNSFGATWTSGTLPALPWTLTATNDADQNLTIRSAVPASFQASGSRGTPGASGSGVLTTDAQFPLDQALPVSTTSANLIQGPNLAPQGTSFVQPAAAPSGSSTQLSPVPATPALGSATTAPAPAPAPSPLAQQPSTDTIPTAGLRAPLPAPPGTTPGPQNSLPRPPSGNPTSQALPPEIITSGRSLPGPPIFHPPPISPQEAIAPVPAGVLDFPQTLIPQQTELIPLLPASTAEGPMVEGNSGPPQNPFQAISADPDLNELASPTPSASWPPPGQETDPHFPLDNIVSIFPGAVLPPQAVVKVPSTAPSTGSGPAFIIPSTPITPAPSTDELENASEVPPPANPGAAIGLGVAGGCLGSAQNPRTAYQVLQDSGRFSSYLSFALRLGLVDFLQDPSLSATVIAPTFQAFQDPAAADVVNGNNSLATMMGASIILGRRDLNSIRTSLNSQVTASSGESGLKLQTLGGELLTVDIVNNRLTILTQSSAISTLAPLESCRSIIYPVDKLVAL